MQMNRLRTYSRREIIRAWVPWVILSACVFLWGVPQFRAVLGPRDASDRGLCRFFTSKCSRTRRSSAARANRRSAEFRFNWLSATGTGIMVAAILSAFWIGISPARFVRLFLHTLHRLRWPLFTIAAMLAIAYTTQYSGTDVTLGLAFTRTGGLYPFFAPLLGWLGVALTGSDTSSNALFGNLQRITAERLGLNPDFDLRLEQHGRRDGKDDRRSEHRRRLGGHRPAWRRRAHSAFRVLAQHRAGDAWWAC